MDSTPRPALVTCYVSLSHSRVKGESHAPVCVLRSHELIPTGAHSRPAALPKPIIISVPKPHCCKGSAAKPYVEFPPHTAPLGMGVGPAQACAVQVVVHDLSLAFCYRRRRFAGGEGVASKRKKKALLLVFMEEKRAHQRASFSFWMERARKTAALSWGRLRYL